MYGAMLGDIIGAPYEFDRGQKTKNFGPLFVKRMMKADSSRYTDDSLMSIAVCEALLNVRNKKDMSEKDIKKEITKSILRWAKKPEYNHIYREYGAKFQRFLASEDPQPYNSMGNGSAMRVSAAGYLFDTLEETMKYARLTAEVSHNHPEGVRGAVAVAAVIFLARTGKSKNEIRDFVVQNFSKPEPGDTKYLNRNYKLTRTLDEIRPGYKHVEICPECVPEAITCFLESDSYEDAIRNAISLGGDTDTIGCIVGSMAEAFYGVPANLVEKCKEYITPGMQAVTDRFYRTVMKLDTVKEEDFAPDKITPVRYIERAKKYGDITNDKIIKGLDEQLEAENTPDKGKEFSLFMKKMMQTGYPVGDVDVLWQVDRILKDETAEQSPEEAQARNSARDVLEEVITGRKDGQPVKLTAEERREKLKRVSNALSAFNKVSEEKKAGVKNNNRRIIVETVMKDRLNAPLAPGDRIRMADSMREMLEILDTTDPPFVISSVEFRAMREALRKFTSRTEKIDPETADEASKRKYEADKNNLKRKVIQYVKYKRDQSLKGRKRSHTEYLRVSAAEAILERLKKDDFAAHSERPKDLKVRNLLVEAKRSIVQRDKTSRHIASAILMSYKLLKDSGKEITYGKVMTEYGRLCDDKLFKEAVNRYDIDQLQDVIENGALEVTYSDIATEQARIEQQKETERQRKIEAEKRRKEQAKAAAKKLADVKKTADLGKNGNKQTVTGKKVVNRNTIKK